MNKTNISNTKKVMAVVISIIVFILSVCTYSTQVSTNAASKTRTYWRHDYSSTNLASHYEYTLTTGSTYNTKSVFPPNNMERDAETAVVRIDGPGGTGFIVDDHVIATAAHCVYNKTNNVFYNFNISIIDGKNNVIKTISPKYAHINNIEQVVNMTMH